MSSGQDWAEQVNREAAMHETEIIDRLRAIKLLLETAIGAERNRLIEERERLIDLVEP